jgi:ASC-1-like (ASCH) protein
MKKHILRFRAVNKSSWLAIKNGTKPIETRAGTGKYLKIQKGDLLVLVCGKSRFSKKIKKVEYFPSISKLFAKYSYKKIMPFAESKKEAEEIYYSYPNYKEKIKKSGIIAFTL